MDHWPTATPVPTANVDHCSEMRCLGSCLFMHSQYLRALLLRQSATTALFHWHWLPYRRRLWCCFWWFCYMLDRAFDYYWRWCVWCLRGRREHRHVFPCKPGPWMGNRQLPNQGNHVPVASEFVQTSRAAISANSEHNHHPPLPHLKLLHIKLPATLITGGTAERGCYHFEDLITIHNHRCKLHNQATAPSMSVTQVLLALA